MARRGDIDDEPSADERTQPVRVLGGSTRLRRAETSGGGVQVASDGPFAVGAVTWRDGQGRLTHTVIAKVGYELAPGMCAPAHEPAAIQSEDGHWDDDPTKSVHAPSDLAPFKAAPEVVIVGSGYAPSDQPRSSVNVRVVVGSVDKSVVAWVPRKFRSDGTIEEQPRQTRFSLRWEHAAGGPGSENPAGIDPDRSDTRGRRSIPEILPPVFEVQRAGDFVPTVGLGPIPASWPARRGYAGDADLSWARAMRERPMPAGFPARYFQVAPTDQWLDRPFAANERLVLEGLHDSVPRLVTSLSGIEPWALVFGSSDPPIKLAGDLLVIDSDRSIATLTFRGQIRADEDADLGVVIFGVPMGSPPPPEVVAALRASARQALLPAGPIHIGRQASEPPKAFAQGDAAKPNAPKPPVQDEDWGETTSVELVTATASTMPFPQAPRGSLSDSALPFAQAQAPKVPPPRPSYPDTSLPFAAPPARPSVARASYPDGALPFRAQQGPSTPPPASPVTFGPPPPDRPPPPAAVTFGAPPAAPPSMPFSAPAVVPQAPITPGVSFGQAAAQPALITPITPAVSFGQAAAAQPALTFGQQASQMASQPAPAQGTIGQQSAAQPSASSMSSMSSMDGPAIAPPAAVASLLAANVNLSSPSPNVVAAPAPAIVPRDPVMSAPTGAMRGMSSLRAEAPANEKPAPIPGGGGGGTPSVKASSDAAAAADREAEKAKNPRAAAKPEGSRRLAIVDLISLDKEVVPRVRAIKRFAAILAAVVKPRVQSIDEQVKKDPAEKDRADILRVLCYGRPDGASQVRDALADSLEDIDLETPLVLVAGELRPTFDEVETLKATIAVVQALAGNDKRILGAVALGQEAVSSSVGPRPDAALGLSKQIAGMAGHLSLPSDYVPGLVERALIEGRKYKRRVLRGGARYRADLTVVPGSEVFPIYVPEDAIQSLPLMASCPVIALCDVRLREDAGETSNEALFPAALGRVVYARKD